VNVKLNLASKPFNNRILPWTLTVVILFVSLIGLVLIVRYTTVTNREAALVQTDINNLKQHEQSLMLAAQQVKDSLTPDQQKALQAAHTLVDRKAFSWSRLLADLEASLPDNVKVTRIAVRGITTEGTQTVAELDLAVLSKSSTTIFEMMSLMDRAGVFHADLLSQTLQKGRGESGTQYELSVVYRPRPGFAIESIAEVQDRTKASEEPR
jgi:Tfp pilus assembly protein PilN